MKNVFMMIPRWNSIYSFPVQGKERQIVDAVYDATAKTCNDSHKVIQLRFDSDDSHHITRILCSRYTFHAFLNYYREFTHRCIWGIDKIH